MSTRGELLTLKKIVVDDTDLKSVPPESLSAIAALGSAINQANVFRMAFMSAQYSVNVEPDLNSIANIQSNTLLRAFSSSVCAINELFGPEGLTKQIGSGSELSDWLSESKEKFKKLKEMPGYKIAVFVRNNNSFHTGPMKKISEDILALKQDLTILIHKKDGNTFFPFGEVAQFSYRLRQQFPKYHEDEWDKLMTQWYEWVMAVYHQVQQVFSEIVKSLLVSKRSDRMVYKGQYVVPAGWLLNKPDQRLPLMYSEKYTSP